MGAGGDRGGEASVDIAAWLHSLGMQQYAAAFRDNAIDERVLPSLTTEDLKDLGVNLVGHRRRLLDAIAVLGAETAASSSDAPARSDAERAVRAGLGITDAVARLDIKSIELRARVGIATGLVVVGDLIGEGSAQEQSSSPFASFRSGVSKPSVNQP